jgi:gentisate 1,2-dioxygenase
MRMASWMSRWGDRHNFGGFRFIVEGRGVYMVESEKFVMEPGEGTTGEAK